MDSETGKYNYSLYPKSTQAVEFLLKAVLNICFRKILNLTSSAPDDLEFIFLLSCS